MNALRDLQWLGRLLVALALVQLAPAAASLIWGEPALPFLASATAAAVPGLLIARGSQSLDVRLRTRDAIALATGAWSLAACFGALPYLMTGALRPVDALFESMAGFTTTAASALRSVEAVPRGLLLWRSMTQWLGGMGVLIVAVGVLPRLGLGDARPFAGADARGSARSERAQFAVSARRLLAVYACLTALAFGCFALAGLGAFDAICHALTVVSTGGFSTRDGSIGGFGSRAVEWVAIGAMFLGGMNFAILYQLATGRAARLPKDGELRYYAGAIAISAALLAWSIATGPDALGAALRPALFQATSMLTGTGYTSANYAAWSGFAQLILVGLMVLGGMSGSTTGGIRGQRLLIGLGALRDSFSALLHPRAVQRVKYAGRVVPESAMAAIWGFMTGFFALVLFAAALAACAGYDLVTAISVGFSLTSNVGAALGAAGPGSHYADLPAYAKLGLGFCMLAGRLDVFVILVLLRPAFWRA
ncbi:MAG TPA: TrkH family potassium uptake protein [Myxococcota bacterium]|nr:TrkH family potassium uptake protein [Myxococcota bacterium]